MSDENKGTKPPEHGVCPQCGSQTNALLFMGVQPDGYVCPKCKLWIAPDGTPLAVVIS
jgi:tRNA(Ile2) C34 agmatinyltransferase TiaS